MVRGRRLRRGYDAVSSAEGYDDDDDNNNTTLLEGENNVNDAFGSDDNSNNNNDDDHDVEAGGGDMVRNGLPRGRQQYQTLTSTDSTEDGAPSNNNNNNGGGGGGGGGGSQDSTTTGQGVDNEEDEEEDGTKVTIVILDPAQKKFHITAYTHWTIGKFKERGQRVHKVAPPSQRLIYRGQLLQDNKTLQESNLITDKLIVHLFPKPRVVIQQQSAGSGAADEETDDDSQSGSGGGGGGAHIPQIILNPDEAEQRAHILVLGSADFLEAQNNVKLFSFLLLVISSIELFNLLLILMGVPPDNQQSNSYAASEDDFFARPMDINATNSLYGSGSSSNPYGNNGLQEDPYQEEAIQHELQTWHPRNNIDLVISALGVYVALLGVRATNETTLRLAQQYLCGTIVVGIAWMMFNYWFTVHVDEEFDELRREERHNRTANSTDPPPIYDDDAIPYKTDYEYYQQNLSLMMIPGMVWILCCVRAWQFQSLLEEAEREAEERIRNELAQHRATVVRAVNGGGNDDDVHDDNYGATDEDGGSDIELPETGRNRGSVAAAAAAATTTPPAGVMT